MKKQTFFSCFCLVSLLALESMASSSFEFESLFFVHSNWQDKLTQENNRLCRMNNDCATIVSLEGDKLLLKWDKWGEESFIYDKDSKRWSNEPPSISLRKLILEKYDEAVYTIEEPMILVNPFKKTPLSALMKFETPDPVEITLKIKGKMSDPDIVHTFKGFKKNHELAVLGLYANEKNIVELEAKTKNNKTTKISHIIQTPSHNFNGQWFKLQKNDKAFRYYGSYEGLVFDENGRIRYQFDSDMQMVYFYNDHVFCESNHLITKYTMLGEYVKTYFYPVRFYGYRHGMGFKDNGNLLVFGTLQNKKAMINQQEHLTHRDIILELDEKNGKVVAQYDLAELLNPDRTLAIKSDLYDYGAVDWAHTNGIDYDPETKAIIVSGRHFGMVKIDEKSQKPLWWLTPHIDIEKSGRNGKGPSVKHLMLTAVDKKNKPFSKNVQLGYEKGSPFKWPLKSHSVKYAGSGYYAILDNSGLDIYDKKQYTTKNSVASVFYIDDKKKTVQQTFIKELDAYSSVGSNVIYDLDKKELLVSLAQVNTPDNPSLSNTHIYRFDETGKLLYNAIMHKDSNSMSYFFQYFDFYAENNWPLPKKKKKSLF